MRRILKPIVLLATLFAGLGLTPSAAAAQGFKLVAHPSFKASDLDKATVEKLFLKKARTVEGQSVEVVDQAVSSSVRAAFSKAVFGRPAQAINDYWQQQVFSGADVPPLSKATDDAVIEFVAKTPGAIGYVSPSAAASGVKSINFK